MSIKLTPEGRVLLPIMGIVLISSFFYWLFIVMPLSLWLGLTISSAMLLLGGFCSFMHFSYGSFWRDHWAMASIAPYVVGGLGFVVSVIFIIDYVS